MKNPLCKLGHAAASVFGVATTVVGVLSDPAVYGYLPHKVAVPVAIAGSVIAAIAKSPLFPREQKR